MPLESVDQQACDNVRTRKTFGCGSGDAGYRLRAVKHIATQGAAFKKGQDSCLRLLCRHT